MAIQFAIGYFLITRQNFLALNFANIIDVAWDNELQYPGYMKEYEEMVIEMNDYFIVISKLLIVFI